MKVLVDLNSNVNNFQIKKIHKDRLISEFPNHEFEFLESYKAFKERVVEAEAALIWIFPEYLFEKAQNLRAVYTPAAGKDWVAVDPAGRVRTYFSRFHGQIISESFLSMLLFFNNQLKITIQNQKDKKWDRNAYPGRNLLKNQSLLIIGYGNIGNKCAAVAKNLGMKVAGTSRKSQGSDEVEIIHPELIEDRIGEFDHVLNVLPGGPETENFVDEALLKSMKKGAGFYNFGRGTTVDEEALTGLLKKKHIGFAGIDVTYAEPLSEDSELWLLENVLLTPHSSCCYDDYLNLFIDELHEKL